MLWRAADRVLRVAATDSAASGSTRTDEIFEVFAATSARVSGRVLLSVREHLQNRISGSEGVIRVFVNRKGHGHAARETRAAA